MKTIIVLAMTTATVSGAMGVATVPGWAPASDARPEALMIGATLLLVASLIRHRFTQSKTRQAQSGKPSIRFVPGED
jgi:hypothetical protein